MEEEEWILGALGDLLPTSDSHWTSLTPHPTPHFTVLSYSRLPSVLTLPPPSHWTSVLARAGTWRRVFGVRRGEGPEEALAAVLRGLVERGKERWRVALLSGDGGGELGKKWWSEEEAKDLIDSAWETFVHRISWIPDLTSASDTETGKQEGEEEEGEEGEEEEEGQAGRQRGAGAGEGGGGMSYVPKSFRFYHLERRRERRRRDSENWIGREGAEGGEGGVESSDYPMSRTSPYYLPSASSPSSSTSSLPVPPSSATSSSSSSSTSSSSSFLSSSSSVWSGASGSGKGGEGKGEEVWAGVMKLYARGRPRITSLSQLSTPQSGGKVDHLSYAAVQLDGDVSSEVEWSTFRLLLGRTDSLGIPREAAEKYRVSFLTEQGEWGGAAE